MHELDILADILPNTQKMPVLFLGHGSPINAIEENEFVAGFRNIAKTIPKPTAILCISAHWFINSIKVTAMDMPRTIHDFGNFPKELFDVQYPAFGMPELAQQTQKLLFPHNVELDYDWGLDHGTWSVLKHLYPHADIPVIQMSIDYTLSAQKHFELAKYLQKLRYKGILIVASGNIIHNLRLADFTNFYKNNHGYDWAFQMQQESNNYIQTGNYQALIDYEKQNKAWKMAIPTPEHYLPLIYTLGLQENQEEIILFNDKLLAGSLSMTSVKVG